MAVSGWCVVNKPRGVTSFDVVRDVRRYYGVRRVGHTGTLDPLATGVLMVAVGQACKLIPYVSGWPKTYTFHVVWGEKRSTGDAEGAVLHASHVRPSEDSVRSILADFRGAVEQCPPRYSAIKVDGERAYRLARQGKEFVLQKRTVTIDSLELLKHTKERTALRVCCSAGTYVRTLGEDIAQALGAYAYVDALHREKVGSVVAQGSEMALASVNAFWPKECRHVVSPEILEELMHGRCVAYQGLREGEPWLLYTAKGDLPACVVSSEGGTLRSKRCLLAEAS